MISIIAAAGWETLEKDFAQFTDVGQLALIATRLLLAATLGGLLGYQRERIGKPAGMRTHMLVALGAAAFMLTPQLEVGIDLSRVMQGVIVGIGFLGGGAILKLKDEHRVEGLTTAADIWLTAAIGMAVGTGRLALALLCTVFAFVILEALERLEERWRRGLHHRDTETQRDKDGN